MSTAIVIGGLTYYIPAVGENNWGQNVSDSIIALAATGGGSGFFQGIVTVTSSPITIVTGRTYLVDTSAARTLNLPAPAVGAYFLVRDTIGTSSTYNITIHRGTGEKIDGVAADLALSVNKGQWWFVSDGTDWFSLVLGPLNVGAGLGQIVNADVNASAAIAYSKLNLSTSIVNGDISGSAAIAKSKLAALGIVNSDVDAAAAIALTKLAALTASKALVSSSGGVIAVSSVTATELGYVSGVTSGIQSQIAAISGEFKLISTYTVAGAAITSKQFAFGDNYREIIIVVNPVVGATGDIYFKMSNESGNNKTSRTINANGSLSADVISDNANGIFIGTMTTGTSYKPLIRGLASRHSYDGTIYYIGDAIYYNSSFQIVSYNLHGICQSGSTPLNSFLIVGPTNGFAIGTSFSILGRLES